MNVAVANMTLLKYALGDEHSESPKQSVLPEIINGFKHVQMPQNGRRHCRSGGDRVRFCRARAAFRRCP